MINIYQTFNCFVGVYFCDGIIIFVDGIINFVEYCRDLENVFFRQFTLLLSHV